MKLALALAVLVAALAAAVVRPRRLPDWLVAAAGAAVLLAAGVVPAAAARDALSSIAPTVAFLAALLLIAEGCRREGLFEALGVALARGAGRDPQRLLGLVFVAAAAVTAVLSLDATVVLLTPVVLVTARRLRARPDPHLYACAHLANSASLLLPISNLTNLLAFRASGLSFGRFGAVMALPWLVAIAVEWVALRRFFAPQLVADGAPEAVAPPGPQPALPAYPLGVLALTLAAFTVSASLGVAEVWVAAAGAAALCAPALVRGRVAPLALVAAAEPGLLVFVLALAVVVRAAGDAGLADAVGSVLPGGDGLLALLGVAGVAAVLANVANNLPATLVLLPLVAASGPTAVLAVLVGVNVGPNLTYAGSLATLLWRRVLTADGVEVELATFTRLGLWTTPAAVVLAVVALWGSAQVLL